MYTKHATVVLRVTGNSQGPSNLLTTYTAGYKTGQGRYEQTHVQDAAAAYTPSAVQRSQADSSTARHAYLALHPQLTWFVQSTPLYRNMKLSMLNPASKIALDAPNWEYNSSSQGSP